MVVSRTLLFLFGACIASAHVLRNGKPCGHKHAPAAFAEIMSKPELRLEYLHPYAHAMEQVISPGLSPFMSHIVQKGSNLFYKPQINLSPSLMPMPIQVAELKKKDCKKGKEPEIVVTEPVQPVVLPAFDEVIAVKPIHVPQAPELPPFVMPEFPTVVVEEPMPPAPMPFIPEAQMVEIPSIPEYRPIEVPSAPELPPFVMPVMPSVVYEEPPKVPCHNEHPVLIPEAHEIAKPIQEIEVVDYRPIPQAPELPPFVMPDMPTVVYDERPVFIPEAPEIVLPLPIQEIEVIEHRPIPQAPELPPFVMPELPTVVYDERPVFVPEAPEIALQLPMKEIEVIEHRPIPQAPELAPFVMPEMPTVVYEEPPKAPCHHEHPVFIPEAHEIVMPLPIQEIEVVDHRPIPEAPELPPFVMPELPVVMYDEPAPLPILAEPVQISPAFIPQSPVVEVHEYVKPLVIPQAPELPPLHLPELPVLVEEPLVIRPVKIPAAPELPAFVMPALPEPIVVESVSAEEPCDDDKLAPLPVVLPQPIDEPCDEDDKPAIVIEKIPAPIALPQPAHLPFSFPTLCADNIIIERVLPNMIYNGQMHEKSLYPVGSKYPVPYFAPALY